MTDSLLIIKKLLAVAKASPQYKPEDLIFKHSASPYYFKGKKLDPEWVAAYLIFEEYEPMEFNPRVSYNIDMNKFCTRCNKHTKHEDYKYKGLAKCTKCGKVDNA